VLHDVLALDTRAAQDACDLSLLLFAVVAADVGDAGNACAKGSCCTRLAVLNGDTFFRFDTDDFASMKIDGWVGFRGRLLQARGGTEDVVVREEVVLADLDDAGTDTSEC
jgi:hypothetical protein